MKILFLPLAFIVSSLICKAQVFTISHQPNKYSIEDEQVLSQGKLKPVYFNFRRRQLKDDQQKTIQPLAFLHLCRTINDSAIQMQVARYDAFTKDKERLGAIALLGGFSAIGLFGSAAATAASGAQGNEVLTGSLVCLGVVGLLAIPAAAIYSSIPHQKRKAVLFQDLPIAYNQYVELQP